MHPAFFLLHPANGDAVGAGAGVPPHCVPGGGAPGGAAAEAGLEGVQVQPPGHPVASVAVNDPCSLPRTKVGLWLQTFFRGAKCQQEEEREYSIS